ncbi:MAG: RDD family protein [Atribacterota bacterium]
MPYCRKCGFSNKFGINKCPKCGTKLPKLEFSKKGKDISESATKSKKENKELSSIPAVAIPKRITAGVVDLLIGIGIVIFIMRVFVFRYILRKALIRGFLSVIIIYALSALYFLLRDSLKGKSIGKLILGLTVVNLERRKPADLADSILRNSLLGMIIIPVVGWIIFAIITAIITVQISLGREQRIGDGFAHTKVIEDKYLDNIYLRIINK